MLIRIGRKTDKDLRRFELRRIDAECKCMGPTPIRHHHLHVAENFMQLTQRTYDAYFLRQPLDTDKAALEKEPVKTNSFRVNSELLRISNL